MSDITVEIRDLDAMTVASALGFGTEPEYEAWELIRGFAERHGLDLTSGEHRFFGFNNPNPSPGSPNYGYEQWMTIDPDIEVEEPLTRKQIPGGQYAVTRLKGIENITETWREFVAWFEESGRHPGRGWDQCLEELLTPITSPPEQWEFELYLPVAVGP
ncbi:MAG: GyrI-like domain-containing protein [Acidimicrobiia bacterium]|nr:GyrI-like domain-containing protein [Acidimicrobiia bacterium]